MSTYHIASTSQNFKNMEWTDRAPDFKNLLDTSECMPDTVPEDACYHLVSIQQRAEEDMPNSR